MTVYCITGKLGSGKTLAAIDRMRLHLVKGRRVATNINLNLDSLMPARSRSTVTRIPDHPAASDLNSLGLGCDSYDEDNFGLLVLDEVGTWMNSRSWNDKGRQALIEWLLHARKLRWHVILLVQHHSLLDKQIREALVEMYGICRRLDRVKFPFLPFKLPKVHVCIVRYGTLPTALVAEKWWYRSTDLYTAYDTGQVFASTDTSNFSMLSAWHLKGRYLKPRMSWQAVLLFPIKLVVYVLMRELLLQVPKYHKL